MELFRAFSSMNNGKGLPKQAEVEAALGWTDVSGKKLWEVDGQFSMELLRAFSSMTRQRLAQTSGGGTTKVDRLPGQKTPGRWMAGSVWSYCAFSSMNSGKGLPKQAEVEAVLGWTMIGGQCNETLQKLMPRLYVSAGIPDIQKLKQYEQKLRDLFFARPATGLESDDEDEQSCLIKQAALFLATSKPRQVLRFSDAEHFYQQETGDADYKLQRLLKLLTSYGGQAVTAYLTLNDNDRALLLSPDLFRTPFPLVMQAINHFPPPERKPYLFFSKNLQAPPDKEQWSQIRLQLDVLRAC